MSSVLYWGSRYHALFAHREDSLEDAVRSARADAEHGYASFIGVEVDGEMVDTSEEWARQDAAQHEYEAEHRQEPPVAATSLRKPDADVWAVVAWYATAEEAEAGHPRWTEEFGNRAKLEVLPR